MLLPEKDWYTIEEVAETFECEVDDIKHFIRAGRIEPVLWFDNEPAILDYGEGEKHPIRLNGLYACLVPRRYSLESSKGTNPVVYSIKTDTKEKSLEKEFIIKGSFKEALKYKKEALKDCLKPPMILQHSEGKVLITDSVLRFHGDSKTAQTVILKADLHKFKSLGNPTKETACKISDILDSNHSWHSKELAQAVEAWLTLYADHEGHRNSNDFKPHGGHKEMIAEWLKDTYGEDTNPTSRKRIAAVVTPCDISGPAKCPKWHKK